MSWLVEEVEQLKRHEGLVLHSYTDSLGFHTIGYGRLIDKRRGGGITREEAEYLLMNDVKKCVRQLESSVSFFSTLPELQKRALVNMCFQLGIHGLLGFRRMLSALKDGDYTRASIEALDSTWAKQTPNRAKEVAAMLRTAPPRGNVL
jgi:lysozyme